MGRRRTAGTAYAATSALRCATLVNAWAPCCPTMREALSSSRRPVAVTRWRRRMLHSAIRLISRQRAGSHWMHLGADRPLGMGQAERHPCQGRSTTTPCHVASQRPSLRVRGLQGCCRVVAGLLVARTRGAGLTCLLAALSRPETCPCRAAQGNQARANWTHCGFEIDPSSLLLFPPASLLNTHPLPRPPCSFAGAPVQDLPPAGRRSLEAQRYRRTSLDAAPQLGRSASLPGDAAVDTAPLYALHHHHAAPQGIPSTITEGAAPAVLFGCGKQIRSRFCSIATSSPANASCWLEVVVLSPLPLLIQSPFPATSQPHTSHPPPPTHHDLLAGVPVDDFTFDAPRRSTPTHRPDGGALFSPFAALAQARMLFTLAAACRCHCCCCHGVLPPEAASAAAVVKAAPFRISRHPHLLLQTFSIDDEDQQGPSQSVRLSIDGGASEHVTVTISPLGGFGSAALERGGSSGSGAQQREGLLNFGRFGLRRHAEFVMQQSALLTSLVCDPTYAGWLGGWRLQCLSGVQASPVACCGCCAAHAAAHSSTNNTHQLQPCCPPALQVLPERAYSSNQVNVLLDAYGHTAPQPGATVRQQSRTLSASLDALMHNSPAGTAGTGGSSANQAGSLLLSQQQSLALARLQSLTGAHVDLLPTALTAASSAGSSGGALAAAMRQVSMVPVELPTISSVVLAPFHTAAAPLDTPMPTQADMQLEWAPTGTQPATGTWGALGLQSSHSGSSSHAGPVAAGPSFLSPFADVGDAFSERSNSVCSSLIGGDGEAVLSPRVLLSARAWGQGLPLRAPAPAPDARLQSVSPQSVSGPQLSGTGLSPSGGGSFSPFSVQRSRDGDGSDPSLFAQRQSPDGGSGRLDRGPHSCPFAGWRSSCTMHKSRSIDPAALEALRGGLQAVRGSSERLSGGWRSGDYSLRPSGGQPGRPSTDLTTPFKTFTHKRFSEDGRSEVEEGRKRSSELGSGDAALSERLAAEAAADVAMLPSVVQPRVRQLSRQLIDIAASLSPANASMLLDRGYSMVVPVLPASIYKHTLVARPNFELRCVVACWGETARVLQRW